MAEQLTLEAKNPEVSQSEEPTRSAPAQKRFDQQPQQDQDDIRKLLDVVQQEVNSWEPEFRSIIARTLEAYEFMKGNHFFDFWAGTTDIFNSFQGFYDYLSGEGDSKEDEDLSLSELPTNFYQMLFFGYQAMLSTDLPRNTVGPENADVGEDRETAKAGTTVMTIIAQKNNSRKLHLKKLFQFWCSGHYWEYTRYIVDAERFKTHKETVLTISKQQVVPDRFVCMNCGTATPLAAVQGQDQPQCPKCGQPLDQQNVFPGYMDDVPVAEEQTDIPNGMVCKNIYGPLHVMFKPSATHRDESPVIRLQFEVSLGWLRDVFPAYYDDLQDGMGAEGSEEQQQRQARLIGMSSVVPEGIQSTVNQDPTFTRDFVQPWEFNKIIDQNVAKRLKAKYPRGCMIAHIGRELILSAQAISIAEEWTCASTCEDVGLAGIPVGAPAIPIQKRFNNLTYMVDDFFERMACGLVIYNAEYIDGKQLNRKGLLPAVFNPVAMRKNSPLRLADLIHQFVFEIEPQLLQYLATLPQQMQAVTGVMPQILGDDPGGNVQTAAGQSQQLSTAKGKLNLYWGLIRGQDAEAAEQGVSCAARNMTDKWWTTVTDKTREFRNEYVHPDQMKGSVHVEPEEDQGFPLTAEQIQAFWEKILNNNNKAIADMLFSEPKNVDACIRSFGVKGLIAPGTLAEARVLHLIDLLMKGEPTQEQVPVKDATGQPAINPDGSPVMQEVDVPSIQAEMFLDDLPSILKIVPDWAVEHYDKWESNEAGKKNLIAFIKLSMEMQFQKQQAMQKAMGPPPGQMPPPKGGQKQLPAAPNH